MEPIDVEPLSGKTMHLYLVIQDDENCSCQIFAETNMTKSLYTFNFESLYRNPKPIDAFPGLYEKKRNQLMLQMGLVKPESRMTMKHHTLDEIPLRDDMPSTDSQRPGQLIIDDDTLHKTIVDRLFSPTNRASLIVSPTATTAAASETTFKGRPMTSVPLSAIKKGV